MINARFYTVLITFCACLFVPHLILSSVGLYQTKLLVDVNNFGSLVRGISFAVLMTSILIAAAHFGGLSKTNLRAIIVQLVSRRSFVILAIAITVLMFGLAAIGVGYKQSESSLNFLIRLVPREFVFLTIALGALFTRRPIWIALTVTHLSYWFVVGSKAPLFLLALSFGFAWALRSFSLSFPLFLGTVLTLALLPFSFLIGVAIRLKMSVFDLYNLILTNELIANIYLSKMFGRVSWFDGFFLTRYDVEPLVHYAPSDFILEALARLLPGVRSDVEPFGIQVVYLFRANIDDGFAGAVGSPGMLITMFFNHGFLGLAAVFIMIFLVFFALFVGISSRNPLLSALAYASFVMMLNNFVISGNLGGAIGKVFPMIFATLIYFGVLRLFLRVRVSGVEPGSMVRQGV